MKKRSVVSVKGLVAACCAFGIVGLTAANVWADSVADLRKKAEQGDTNAQGVLGRKYLSGEGVPEDSKEAAKWFRKCAEKGDARCQYALGGMYIIGEGVSQDDKEAAKWFRKAADQNLAKAEFQLSTMYAQGKGVPEDIDVAVEWLRRAAEHGDETAKQALKDLGL